MVSVYITNYNYEKFIRTSIASVFQQTLQDFELLIIDDGPTDNSKASSPEYRDHPKVTIIYQKNKGLNVTNNIAMPRRVASTLCVSMRTIFSARGIGRYVQRSGKRP